MEEKEEEKENFFSYWASISFGTELFNNQPVWARQKTNVLCTCLDKKEGAGGRGGGGGEGAAEIQAMVNTRSDWCCLFEEFLTKYDNTRAYFPQLGSRYTNRNSRLYLYKQKWGSDTFVAKTP